MTLIEDQFLSGPYYTFLVTLGGEFVFLHYFWHVAKDIFHYLAPFPALTPESTKKQKRKCHYYTILQNMNKKTDQASEFNSVRHGDAFQLCVASS